MDTFELTLIKAAETATEREKLAAAAACRAHLECLRAFLPARADEPLFREEGQTDLSRAVYMKIAKAVMAALEVAP